jgi:hypothetical protein
LDDGEIDPTILRIALIVEGQTEKAFLPCLRSFIERRLEKAPPRLQILKQAGRIPKKEKLKKIVDNLLSEGAGAVIALTDVYTGQREFEDAAEAIRKMREWVGENNRFFPHAAQHDFEAWLLPYWERIKSLSGSNHSAPPGKPEAVNHAKPPSTRIAAAYRQGKKRDYIKAREAIGILEGQDLEVAARECPRLREFLNTLLTLSDGEPLP